MTRIRSRRAARVRGWLQLASVTAVPEATLASRTADLMKLGFRNLDALHVASARSSHGTDVFSSCDDRLLAVAARNASVLRVRVLGPIQLSTEVLR